MSRCLILAFLLSLSAGAAMGGSAKPSLGRTETAVAAYDAGDYETACRLLAELDRGGTLNGPLLYRLFYCRSVAADPAGARRALERAVATLEAENVPGAHLEVPFYLANAYANLGRATQARRVAEETLLRLEQDGFRPTTPMEWFQLGKLAQDSGRNDRAESAYREAIRGFETGTGAPGHERWARRFLGDAALARADYVGALPHWERIVTLGNAERADFLSLATAAARTQAWELAAEAWRRAEKIDMRIGSDPRYASALARQAATLGSLPRTDGEGVPWTSHDRAGLEGAMAAASAEAREIRSAAEKLREEGKWDPSARQEAAERLQSVRTRFVAAGIEYAVRRLPIRETAFTGQFATLVFQQSEWDLPPAEPHGTP
jgi:tetratricopeptide (TPR) repeat protein